MSIDNIEDLMETGSVVVAYYLLKDVRHHLCRDADAIVSHADDGLALPLLSKHLHLTIFR